VAALHGPDEPIVTRSGTFDAEAPGSSEAKDRSAARSRDRRALAPGAILRALHVASITRLMSAFSNGSR
jgi:hypothetical protein